MTAQSQSAEWIVRTALCVEPREGRLHIFMPPVGSTEDYLELISAVEETATELRKRLRTMSMRNSIPTTNM